MIHLPRWLLAIVLGLAACSKASVGTVGRSEAAPQSATFRFIAWGDTKAGTDTLAALSRQAKALNPQLAFYGGDLEVRGFTKAGLDLWKSAMNGDPSGDTSDGMFDIDFPVRGNHDILIPGTTAGWQGYLDARGRAQAVGATHFSELAANLTYSFDYGNSHFVGVDVPGDVTLMTGQQVTWIDQDLTAAEGRGVTHSFLQWHGPLWTLAEHCCAAVKPEIVEVFNKHPSVSATFHGHEHVHAWVHMNSTRYPNLTHEFEEIVAARAGAGPAACQPGRTDYCQDQESGFVAVEVTGKTFVVSFFQQGTTAPVHTLSFTKP